MLAIYLTLECLVYLGVKRACGVRVARRLVVSKLFRSVKFTVARKLWWEGG